MNRADDGGAGPSQAERVARLRGDGLGFDDRGAIVPIVEFDVELIDGEPDGRASDDCRSGAYGRFRFPSRPHGSPESTGFLNGNCAAR